MTPNQPIANDLICYVALFASLFFCHRQHSNRLFNGKQFASNRPLLIGLHLGASLLMILSCINWGELSPWQTITGDHVASPLQILVIGILVVAAMFIATISAERELASSYSFDSPGAGFFAGYFVARIIFLITYETWLRGHLLSTTIDLIGATPAIVVNILLYSLLHWVNGKREMLACIPLGLLFSVLCLWTNAAWPAILIHLAMTLSHETYIVKKLTTLKSFSYENIH